eukprot:TRINITY_DN8313_c0_g1_i2.p1 TRINITY_DN8313_c0_g1~~TRINITY_DN8313_c0_g1_i2.p1  ORF type:complete len:248 (+),score=50.67 TRINITY_DN8313_c0_g1_i2:38-745(+)
MEPELQLQQQWKYQQELERIHDSYRTQLRDEGRRCMEHVHEQTVETVKRLARIEEKYRASIEALKAQNSALWSRLRCSASNRNFVRSVNEHLTSRVDELAAKVAMEAHSKVQAETDAKERQDQLCDVKRQLGTPALTLLRVIKNPITDPLPTGCLKTGTSHTSRKVNLYDFVNKLEDKPIVFVIGAISHGNISPDFTEDSVCISECKLSAAGACAKLCNAFEEKWVSRDITDLDR